MKEREWWKKRGRDAEREREKMKSPCWTLHIALSAINKFPFCVLAHLPLLNLNKVECSLRNEDCWLLLVHLKLRLLHCNPPPCFSKAYSQLFKQTMWATSYIFFPCRAALTLVLAFSPLHGGKKTVSKNIFFDQCCCKIMIGFATLSHGDKATSEQRLSQIWAMSKCADSFPGEGKRRAEHPFHLLSPCSEHCPELSLESK